MSICRFSHLLSSDRHFFHEQRAAADAASRVLICTNSSDTPVEIAQVSCDSHLMDRVKNFAVLYPLPHRAARVVAGNSIDTLTDKFFDDQASAHLFDERLEVTSNSRDIKIATASGRVNRSGRLSC